MHRTSTQATSATHSIAADTPPPELPPPVNIHPSPSVLPDKPSNLPSEFVGTPSSNQNGSTAVAEPALDRAESSVLIDGTEKTELEQFSRAEDQELPSIEEGAGAHTSTEVRTIRTRSGTDSMLTVENLSKFNSGENGELNSVLESMTGLNGHGSNVAAGDSRASPILELTRGAARGSDGKHLNSS